MYSPIMSLFISQYMQSSISLITFLQQVWHSKRHLYKSCYKYDKENISNTIHSDKLQVVHLMLDELVTAAMCNA